MPILSKFIAIESVLTALPYDPVTFQVMVDPQVHSGCGNSFNSDTLNRWFDKKTEVKCPLCGCNSKKSDYVPNRDLKRSIDALLKVLPDEQVPLVKITPVMPETSDQYATDLELAFSKENTHSGRLAVASEQVRCYPNVPNYRFNLAFLLLLTGQYKNACQEYEACLCYEGLSPIDYGNIRAGLALSAIELGDAALAKAQVTVIETCLKLEVPKSCYNQFSDIASLRKQLETIKQRMI